MGYARPRNRRVCLHNTETCQDLLLCHGLQTAAAGLPENALPHTSSNQLQPRSFTAASLKRTMLLTPWTARLLSQVRA